MQTLQQIIDIEQFNNLEWIATQVVEGFIAGTHRSPFHGFSAEFAEHRLYNQGESTRHIDWKLFARTDKFFVKQYNEETNLRCHILLDTSSSMLFPMEKNGKSSKLSFGIYCTAALTHLLRRQRDAVGLTLFSDGIDFQTDARLTESHIKLIYSQLNQLLISQSKAQLNRKTDLSQALHTIADNIHRRSLVVLFSDLFTSNQDELVHAIEHLKYNKHEVVVFQLTDCEHEQNLKFKNRPIKFVDMETGETIKLNPNEIRQFYQQQMAKQNATLRTRCGQLNIDFVEADINQPFADVLSAFLIKRSRCF